MLLIDMNTVNIEDERAYPTPFALSPLLPLLLMSLARQKHSPDTANRFQGEYDYIIVGAGSGGSTLAGRLSEKPCVSILLLEAGKPPPLLTEVPATGRFFFNSDIDWQYRTVPLKYTGAALVNRQSVWPSGKTLGGSSVLNQMIYSRGNRRDYDRWAADGAEGWSYKDVLPYFKKMEDNRDPEYVADGYHGVGGPLTVHRPRYQAEIKNPIFKAALSLGYDIVDTNGARPIGFYDLQATQRSGQRCSTAKAYLVPAENRPNLDILPNAMVRKVLIKNREAVGVEFDFQNTTYQVKARREVIMSAGTVNTAQLLMLSGIGPKKELQRFKIPVIADLPVGKNFQDHGASILNFLVNPDIPTIEEKVADPRNILQYIQNRTGPLASAEFCSGLSFLRNGVTVSKGYPENGIAFIEASAAIGIGLGLTPEASAQLYGPYTGRPFYACVVAPLLPRSRGTITLQSRNPYDSPVIDPNYLEDPKDMEDIVEGMKSCMRIATSAPMRKVGSTPFPTLIPGCEKHAGDEDMYFRCTARSVIFSLSHPVGTARMGHQQDPRTVVDPQLRVKGIERLRVIDASVMPTITSGNTNVPTIMIAEKASDIMKSTIQCHGNTRSKEWKANSSEKEDPEQSDRQEKPVKAISYDDR